MLISLGSRLMLAEQRVAFEPAQILVGGLAGFASAAALRWWQYKRDLWLSRVERFCVDIDKAADVATEYWLKSKAPAEIDDDDAGVISALDVHEARIIGLQIRMDGGLVTFSERLCRDDQRALEQLSNDFTSAMTGGDFGALARPPDPDRARLVQMYASELALEARRSAARALEAWHTFRYLTR